MDDIKQPGAPAEPEADDEELTLAAPDGLSETERLLRSRVYFPFSDVSPARKAGQYSLASLLAMTFFVALGFAGQAWLPASLFAGVVGLLALLALIWVSVCPPETAAGRLLWRGINVAYISAIVAALIRQAA